LTDVHLNRHIGPIPNSSNSLGTFLPSPNQRPPDAHRVRSGSFNPNILASTHSTNDFGLNRERSYSDVHNLQVQFKTLLQQKSSDGSSEASEEFIVDFVEVQCFLHTGMILDVSVHPDDSIFQIKQIILNSATADGKLRVTKIQSILSWIEK